jgi:hypothetical protein
MKYTLAFLISACLLLCTCTEGEESDPYNQPLPTITTTGEHTFGFLLDGKSWIPGMDDITQKPINVVMDKDSIFMFSINLINKKFNRNEAIKIIFSCNMPGIIKSPYVTFVDSNLPLGCQLYTLTNKNLIFEVSYIDFEKQIISGTFEVGKAVNACNDREITVTDGRFDCKFTK